MRFKIWDKWYFNWKVIEICSIIIKKKWIFYNSKYRSNIPEKEILTKREYTISQIKRKTEQIEQLKQEILFLNK